MALIFQQKGENDDKKATACYDTKLNSAQCHSTVSMMWIRDILDRLPFLMKVVVIKTSRSTLLCRFNEPFE